MAKKIKGDKSLFAIELEITGKVKQFVFAKFCLWIGGIRVGFYESGVILSFMRHSISCEPGSYEEFEGEDLKNVDPEVFFQSLFEIDEEVGKGVKDCYGKNLLSLPDSFDRYMVFCFKQNEDLHFFWDFSEENNYDVDLNHPKGVQHKIVDYKTFYDIVEDEELWKAD